MKTTIKITILTLSIFFFLIPNQTKAQCHIDDWTALKALYESTDGDFWTNRIGWGTVLGNNPPANCNLEMLHGVDLDEQGRVEKLYMTNNALNGSIPAELSNLSNLTFLSLNRNQLSGSIPAELGNLTKLTSLSFFLNELSGSIPVTLSYLSNLTYLNLHQNQLNGSIPAQLGNLSNLTFLDLGANQLSGNIPVELSNLSNLTDLRLYINQLSGDIPAELGNLINVTLLWLDSNQFSSGIPIELGNLSNLTSLRLKNNELSGSIPAELCELANLTRLEINNNNLQGCYPNCMIVFCSQLTNPNFDGNPDISNGNNFDAPWEDFCATGAGACDGEPICGCTDPTACNYNPIATCDNGSCESNCEETNVYPGDLNNDGIVNNQDISLSGLFHYNSGPERTTEHQNTDWYAHPAENWNILNNQNKDIKHHDCNGDGQIDEDDGQVVEEHLGLTWKTPDSPTPPDNTEHQVLLQPVEQLIDGYLIINVALERKDGGNLEVQGGFFTVDYNEIEVDFSNVLFNLQPSSWLGIPNLNLEYSNEHFPAEKKIEVGYTKNDNTNSIGRGVVGQLIFEFDNNTFRQSKEANDIFVFEVHTIGAHDIDANSIPIEDQILQVNTGTSICEPNWIISESTPFQNLYQSSGNISTNGFVLIGADQQVAYQANRITLNSGFSIKMGDSSRFKAGYGSCN